MIKLALYLLVFMVIFTVVKGLVTGKMDGNTTLYEVGSAMKDYRGN